MANRIEWLYKIVGMHLQKLEACDTGVDVGGGCRGCAPPPEMTCSFLIQLVFYQKRKKKKKTMWFIGVEVEQETSAPPPENNPGSAPVIMWDSTAHFKIICTDNL